MNKNDIVRLLGQHRETLKLKYGFDHIFLFGSFATNRATQKSDVDFLVDVLKSKKTYGNFVQSKAFLAKLLNRKVDLVYRDSLHPVIGEDIQGDMIEI